MLQLFEYILEYLRTVRFNEPDHSLALPADQAELAQIVREVSICLSLHQHHSHSACDISHEWLSMLITSTASVPDSACIISREWLSMLHEYMKCQLGFTLAFTREHLHSQCVASQALQLIGRQDLL